MQEPTILPVKPGTVSDADKAALRDAGVVVIEHEAPHELRLLRPGYDLPGGALLLAAAKALKTENSLGADAQRQAFGKNVADALISTMTANTA